MQVINKITVSRFDGVVLTDKEKKQVFLEINSPKYTERDMVVISVNGQDFLVNGYDVLDATKNALNRKDCY